MTPQEIIAGSHYMHYNINTLSYKIGYDIEH